MLMRCMDEVEVLIRGGGGRGAEGQGSVLMGCMNKISRGVLRGN